MKEQVRTVFIEFVLQATSAAPMKVRLAHPQIQRTISQAAGYLLFFRPFFEWLGFLY